jgi:hypothetical protein
MIDIDASVLFEKEYINDEEFSIWDILHESHPNFKWIAVDARELSGESIEELDWLIKQHGVEFVSIDDGSDHWVLSTIKTEELNMLKAHESGLIIPKNLLREKRR